MKNKVNTAALTKVIMLIFSLFGLFVFAGLFLVVGFVAGYARGVYGAFGRDFSLTKLVAPQISEITHTASPAPVVYNPSLEVSLPTWGGPALWAAVNKKRIEYGVNPLSNKDELCTIAAIRLSEILELGKLDGHEGFSNMSDRRQDLRPIFEAYTVSEFLLSGASTPDEAVRLWENTLGHKKLLTGGEYVWGCIYAQAGFAVAIAAY